MTQMRGLRRPPSPAQQLQRNRVRDPSMVGAIWQPLYDYQTKTAAATSQQTFFQTPIGQSGKTISDTNMISAGQLPLGNRFAITGIQVELYPTMDVSGAALSQYANDIQDFYRSGALVLTIGNKDFATQAPLIKFPPVNGLSIQTSSGTTSVNTTYGTAIGREFATNEMYIESNQSFSVSLYNLSAISADARIGVTLNGWLYRDVQ
jgi:hypothetical protein